MKPEEHPDVYSSETYKLSFAKDFPLNKDALATAFNGRSNSPSAASSICTELREKGVIDYIRVECKAGGGWKYMYSRNLKKLEEYKATKITSCRLRKDNSDRVLKSFVDRPPCPEKRASQWSLLTECTKKLKMRGATASLPGPLVSEYANQVRQFGHGPHYFYEHDPKVRQIIEAEVANLQQKDSFMVKGEDILAANLPSGLAYLDADLMTTLGHTIYTKVRALVLNTDWAKTACFRLTYCTRGTSRENDHGYTYLDALSLLLASKGYDIIRGDIEHYNSSNATGHGSNMGTLTLIFRRKKWSRQLKK